MGNAPSCNPRTAADWLADGCVFVNPTGTTVFDLGTHSRVTPTTSCEVTCPTDGGDFVVTSATGLTAITDANVHAAVSAWVNDPAAAEATCGHIKWWDTGAVTDMSLLFCGTSLFQQCTATDQKQLFASDLAHW